MRTGVILIAMIIAALTSTGQDYYRWLSFAEEAKEDGDDLGAVIYYENAFALDSSRQELQFALAEAYENAGYYSEAHRLFLKVYSKGRGRFFPKGPAHIAQLKMYRKEYESAIEFWRRALRTAEDEGEKAFIRQRMISCSYALSHPLKDEEITVETISDVINTSDSEYGSEWSGDSLFLFSSLRGTYTKNYEVDSVQAYYAQIYSSHSDPYGYADPEAMSINGISSSLHVIHPSLSDDSERLFFALCDDEGRCDIAMASRADDRFKIQGILDEDPNDLRSNTQPFYFKSDAKEYILFSSNREDGYGGFDLWLGELMGETIQNIRNLGPEINSPGNEVTPFYNTASSTLFFSSDWHPGYGDLDIFSAHFELSKTIQDIPKNLGLPINSSAMDICYKERDRHRYLSSNRPGSLTIDAAYCCTDIYEVRAADQDTMEIIHSDAVPSSITSVDELKGLLPISLYFHNDVPDPGSLSNSTDIRYDETVDGYTSLREKYSSAYSENRKDSVGESARMAMNSFFDNRILGEFKKLEGVSKLILTELEKGLRIEIAIKGYASPLAESDYNRKLTQRRIKSIINYLKDLDDGALRPYMNGDSPELSIRAIPYGEEESDSFVSDNPQDAKNSIYSIAAMRERRVEILRIQEQD